MTVININKSEIAKIDHSSVIPYIEWNAPSKGYIQEQPGKEHYKLLTYIMKRIVESGEMYKASDLGTLFGTSALALASAHPTIEVTTYDIINVIPNAQGVNTINNMSNIKRKHMSAQIDIPEIAKSNLVFLDINTADGVEEQKIINALIDHEFSGLLIVNGILLNTRKDFWNKISNDKRIRVYDLSDVGHWTGTGLVNFSQDTDIIIK